jgi:hypothetical protein
LACCPWAYRHYRAGPHDSGLRAANAPSNRATRKAELCAPSNGHAGLESGILPACASRCFCSHRVPSGSPRWGRGSRSDPYSMLGFHFGGAPQQVPRCPERLFGLADSASCALKQLPGRSFAPAFLWPRRFLGHDGTRDSLPRGGYARQSDKYLTGPARRRRSPQTERQLTPSASGSRRRSAGSRFPVRLWTWMVAASLPPYCGSRKLGSA